MQQDDYSRWAKCRTDPVKAPVSLIMASAGMHALVLALAGKSWQFMSFYRSDHSARMLIHTIVAANLCLIALHICLRIIAYLDFYEDRLFHPDLLINAEGGYPEMFNYFQLAVLGGLMFQVFVRTRQAIYAVLGILSVFAVGDDALQLHERVGRHTASIDLPAPSSLGAQHFGEVLYWIIVGALWTAALAYGLVTSSAEDRKIGASFFLLVVMLGSFVTVFDTAHVVLRDAFFGADFILGMVEDGGEMLMAALALSAALLLCRHLDDLGRPSRRGARSQ